MLFRAGLESDKKFHSLASELNFCKRYIELERWRLEERLKVVWQIELPELNNYQTPKLLLQPLIENAILHGQNSQGNVSITVDVRESKKDLSIVIENTKGVLNHDR